MNADILLAATTQAPGIWCNFSRQPPGWRLAAGKPESKIPKNALTSRKTAQYDTKSTHIQCQ
jgi:hypothetical protein